jgi:hypothetical protein
LTTIGAGRSGSSDVEQMEFATANGYTMLS